MDIQRKQVLQPRQAPLPPSMSSTPKASFDAELPRIIPAGKPRSLGEEKLWPEPVFRTTPVKPEFLSGEQEAPVYELPAKPSLIPPAFTFPSVFLSFRPMLRKSAWGVCFLMVGILIYGFAMKNSIESSVATGMQNTEQGIDSLGEKDFSQARIAFLQAEKNFKTARLQTLYFPPLLAKPLTFIPGISKFGSGVLAIDASTHLARAGLEVTSITEAVVTSREKVEKGETVSYLALLEELALPLGTIRSELKKADRSLQRIPERDIPEEQRLTFALLQKGVPSMVGGIDSFLANKPLIEELLGKNGPRIYLFLFQNNQELRPTGGFIGTYGILEFKDGHARRFFIDGIFNPDGQLKENIIPPKPIQKISAGWSLHDSNWFPDFPTSAEKAIFFYEKTGGPTVDGVFTLTPTVLERLLAFTGPIELPEYEMVVDSKNFIPTIQEQVEIKYDREENKPKKVLADLSSILMERVFSLTDPVAIYQVANIFVEGMNERHILLYTRNQATQNLIAANGWSGNIDESPHDYLSVIHTNVNGYKTDGVIDDTIDHTVTIQEDGSVIATTSVTRVHTGGNTPYEWWNKVNSDYMRVYVPKGSRLIAATGHTREFPPAPLDYQLLGFTEDQTVKEEEARIIIDEASGTRVGEEFGKTVFGNWVYVSPGETVKVEYTYLLPFTIDPTKKNSKAYSLLFQKQPGVEEVSVNSRLSYPKNWSLDWQTEGDLLTPGESGIQVERTTKSDMFWGVIFDK